MKKEWQKINKQIKNQNQNDAKTKKERESRGLMETLTIIIDN